MEGAATTVAPSQTNRVEPASLSADSDCFPVEHDHGRKCWRAAFRLR